MPALLTALARIGDADLAFLAFDRFLAGLPAGVQLFSLLKANPRLLDLIATILGTAPRLAEQLSRRPKVLDAVLDPGFFDAAAAPRPRSASCIAAAMPEGVPLDEVVDRARIVGKEQAFRIGVRVLSETVSAAEAGLAFSISRVCCSAGCMRVVARSMQRPPWRGARRAQCSDCHGQAGRARDDGGLRSRSHHRL